MTRQRAALAVVAALVYAAMWIGYLQGWGWLTAADSWFLDGLYRVGAAHPGWVSAWNVFCAVLSPMTFRVLALVAIVWLLMRKDSRTALFLMVTVVLNGLVIEGAKRLVDRPRPTTALVDATSTSFPSGHALGDTVSVLALLTVLPPMVAPRWRTPMIVLGAVMVVAIGFGRVALNVHHPSDVVAGWALGYLYYVICLPIYRGRLTAAVETPEALDSGQ